MALAAIAHPFQHICRGQALPGQPLNDGDDDPPIHFLEMIMRHQGAEIAGGQIVPDLQHVLIIARQLLERFTPPARGAPAAEHQRGIGVQGGSFSHGPRPGAGKQRDGEILKIRRIRRIAITRGHVLPEELRQPDPIHQLQRVITAFGQFGQQRLDHRIEIAIRTSADCQHLATDIIGALRRPLALDRAQRFHPLAGTVKFGVITDGGFILRRNTKISHPDRRLIGAEHGAGQLHIQQPVLRHRRLGAVLIEQKPRLRLLPQHAVFQAEFVVGDLHLGHAGQVHRIERCAQIAGGVIPEDDAIALVLIEPHQAGGDAVSHPQPPAP